MIAANAKQMFESCDEFPKWLYKPIRYYEIHQFSLFFDESNTFEHVNLTACND